MPRAKVCLLHKSVGGGTSGASPQEAAVPWQAVQLAPAATRPRVPAAGNFLSGHSAGRREESTPHRAPARISAWSARAENNSWQLGFGGSALSPCWARSFTGPFPKPRVNTRGSAVSICKLVLEDLWFSLTFFSPRTITSKLFLRTKLSLIDSWILLPSVPPAVRAQSKHGPWCVTCKEHDRSFLSEGL